MLIIAKKSTTPKMDKLSGVFKNSKIKAKELLIISVIIIVVTGRPPRHDGFYAPQTTERTTLIPTKTTETAIPIIK